MTPELLAEIKKANEVIRNGGIILYPTDTIWGIGCDATNEKAVEKIYNLKKREESKSMILLLDAEGRLLQYVKDVPDQAYDLIEVSDKPLTIIYDDAKNLPSNLIAADGSIAIRICKDEFCKNLIGQMRKPLVSTSANLSGEKSPATFDDISEEIKNGVDHIVNWRQHERQSGQASEIIRIRKGGLFEIVRRASS
ncbi:MAG: threonylcarbamoyl-AMP synthase [Bacteroidetes bacterium]|nr:threonylcarbamoyl-AMP synthase [Bacteroidota bacterium]